MNIINNFLEDYISSIPDAHSLSSFIRAVGFVIIILALTMAFCLISASLMFLMIYVICECCESLGQSLFERNDRDRDIEMGFRRQAWMESYQIELQNDLQLPEIPEGHSQVIEEMQVIRRKDLEKLLPPTYYRSDELTMNSKDCAICLEDYKEGELCRVIPNCKHMFHLKCIDTWFKNHLTCPICRKCII